MSKLCRTVTDNNNSTDCIDYLQSPWSFQLEEEEEEPFGGGTDPWSSNLTRPVRSSFSKSTRSRSVSCSFSSSVISATIRILVSDPFQERKGGVRTRRRAVGRWRRLERFIVTKFWVLAAIDGIGVTTQETVCGKDARRGTDSNVLKHEMCRPPAKLKEEFTNGTLQCDLGRREVVCQLILQPLHLLGELPLLALEREKFLPKHFAGGVVCCCDVAKCHQDGRSVLLQTATKDVYQCFAPKPIPAYVSGELCFH